jgi:cytochrome b subunit of formate dehydrogenase
MSDFVVRFSRRQRIEHALIMSIFTLLALTGFPQKFYDAGWAHTIVSLFGGIERMRFVHRMCGIAFAASASPWQAGGPGRRSCRTGRTSATPC